MGTIQQIAAAMAQELGEAVGKLASHNRIYSDRLPDYERANMAALEQQFRTLTRFARELSDAAAREKHKEGA